MCLVTARRESLSMRCETSLDQRLCHDGCVHAGTEGIVLGWLSNTYHGTIPLFAVIIHNVSLLKSQPFP